MSQPDNVARVASRLACQCGVCHDTAATCTMYGCWSHQARQKIAHMQAAGLSDSAIVDDFVKAYGKAIYRAAPGALGWAIPYLMLALGAAVVVRFLRRALL